MARSARTVVLIKHRLKNLFDLKARLSANRHQMIYSMQFQSHKYLRVAIVDRATQTAKYECTTRL